MPPTHTRVVPKDLNGSIPITSLNPDTNGDSKVEKWEADVYERIKAAEDADKSSSISTTELFSVIRGAAAV